MRTSETPSDGKPGKQKARIAAGHCDVGCGEVQPDLSIYAGEPLSSEMSANLWVTRSGHASPIDVQKYVGRRR